MDAKATATLEKIKNAAKGEAFDQAYITAQLENHEDLRDWAMAYLTGSVSDKNNMVESRAPPCDARAGDR